MLLNPVRLHGIKTQKQNLDQKEKHTNLKKKTRLILQDIRKLDPDLMSQSLAKRARVLGATLEHFSPVKINSSVVMLGKAY